MLCLKGKGEKMTIQLSTPFCPHCINNSSSPAILKGRAYDSNMIDMTCSNGHTIKMLLSVPRYVLLFENGLTAFNNEFYFEAFTCFYSSLESFRKIFVETYTHFELGLSVEDAEIFVKNLYLSERILGAFELSYAAIFKEILPKRGNNILKDDDISLRNKVFHSGKIPTEKEVNRIGDRIYKFIEVSYRNYCFEDGHPKIFTFNNNLNNKILIENNVDLDKMFFSNNYEYGLYQMQDSIGYHCYTKDKISSDDIPQFKSILETNSNLAKNYFSR